MDSPVDGNFPASTSRRRIPVNEEPVFDAGTSNFTPDERFLLDETTILPNADDFFPRKQFDPWRRMSALEHDCILLVEFSELEGPRPLMCIPESPGTHFESNDFSVWLMTADYQASSHRGGPFFISEDIQMLLSNEEQGVHTYAHHFTLFDIEARGYVRPFCVTYVTPDCGKLTRLFDMLRLEFSSILRAVKTCNRRQFRKALTEAVEALNVIETQAISSYYELYYDGKFTDSAASTPASKSSDTSPSHSSSKPQPPDELNTRYRRLQRELLVAQNCVADDLRSRLRRTSDPSSSGCGTHVVNMDHWINSLRRGEGTENHKKILKEFHELCPCVADEFQRRIRSIWMKHRRWNSTAAWVLQPRDSYGAKLNLGAVPIVYLPSSGERKLDTVEYSVTEVDALHQLLQHKRRSNDDKDQNRLLLAVAPHLRYFLYPILTGQLLIAYGSDLRRQLIVDLIQKLKFFIPSIFASPLCPFWNDDSSASGILPASALEDYKIVGVRVGQKEKIADFVNDDMKRYVALLDLNADTFHVADYKGDILNRLIARSSSHRSDWTLTMAIFGVVSEFSMLAYVFSYAPQTTAIAPTNGTNGFSLWQKRVASKSKDGGGTLKLQSGDLKIARYFVELLNVQLGDVENGNVINDEEERDQGLLLDYEPAQLHKL